MENQSIPSSSSSTHNDDQKLKSIVVASLGEKEKMKNLEQRSPREIVSERPVTERPSFELSLFRPVSSKTHPPTNDEVFICHPCERGFRTRHALACHRGHHKVDRVLKRQPKKTDSTLSDESFTQAVLLNSNHLRISQGPLYSKEGSGSGSGSGNSSIVHQLGNGRLTKGFTDFMNRTWGTHRPSPLSYFTENTSYSYPSSYQGLSLGPFMYGGGGSGSSSSADALFDAVARGMAQKKTTMFPPPNPDRFLTGNNRYITSSTDPLPSYNCSSHALRNNNHIVPFHSYQGLSFGPYKYGGIDDSSINRLYSLFNGDEAARRLREMKTAMFPPPTPDHFLTGNTSSNTSARDLLPSYNCSSQALTNGINLELTLGQPNSSNDGSNAYSFINEEVSRGTKDDVIIPVRPRVSLYHFVAGNPLDSIITSIPPSPQTTNLANGLFALKENGESFSHSGSAFSKVSEENGESFSHSGSAFSKVSEEDEVDIEKIRWLTKKKRSPRRKSGAGSSKRKLGL